jgi:predicted metal-binding membrane protein
MILWKAVPGNASHSHLHHAVAGPNQELFLTQTFWWLVMVVAMMFPLLPAHIRNTAARSLWGRRHRAIGGFLVGYVGPWILFGLAAVGILFVLEIPRTASALIGFSAAFIWQVMPARRRTVLACHRTRPIAPVGLRADFDCVRYGWMVGNNCVLSCWALMLACLLFGHSIVAMIGLTAVGLVERSTPRPKQLFAISVITGLGVLHLIW